jgi:hypothetical protein
MLDRLFAFCLLAHGLQAVILFLDTRAWRDGAGCPALRRWRLRLRQGRAQLRRRQAGLALGLGLGTDRRRCGDSRGGPAHRLPPHF